MKKYMKALLILFFALQIGMLSSQIFTHYDTLSNGEQFQFVVAPYDPYDPFRGRYVTLRTEESLYNQKTYAILARNEQGFAIVQEWTNEKPRDGHYAKNLRLERYYMNEAMAPEAERIGMELEADERLTLLVRVKNGNYVIEGLSLNGTPIEQLIV